MCGIIGIVGKTSVAERLIESLRRLEYRGYDSAGVAAVSEGRVLRRRAVGKIRALDEALRADPLSGTVGIGHTRWATHGAATDTNAHPHKAGRVTVVHNGIIENFAELKAALQARGRSFESETDTEVIAHLIDCELESGKAPLEAFKATLDQLNGAYALGVLVEGKDRFVMGARRGSPLVVGWGDGEMFIGSDALAVGPFTQRVSYLEEGDYVGIDDAGARIFDVDGAEVQRPPRNVSASAALVEKGNYRHFMEKEIHEQPDSVQHTLAAYVDPITKTARAPGEVDFKAIERIQIVACGTSFFAALVAKYAFERLAGLPVDVEIASEFRYREPALSPNTLALGVSQSGETADTLAALRYCKAQGLRTAGMVNVHESTMAREVDLLWPTYAGPEIAVASTKVTTAQMAALSALAVAAAVRRGRVAPHVEVRLVRALLEAPRLIAQALADDSGIRQIAYELSKARDVLYFGRGAMYPVALEGALKLKELSYIHAEGFAAGELKHGSIALVDENTPVVVIAPFDSLYDKTMSSLEQVAARGGRVILITDEAGRAPQNQAARVIEAPASDPLVAPIIMTIPVQLLAYHTAVQKGTDVDQPRNLAKSVTVE
jgi:glucosamine--fructose-6-phosphate aminotransferase (isomerizing)